MRFTPLMFRREVSAGNGYWRINPCTRLSLRKKQGKSRPSPTRRTPAKTPRSRFFEKPSLEADTGNRKSSKEPSMDIPMNSWIHCDRGRSVRKRRNSILQGMHVRKAKPMVNPTKNGCHPNLTSSSMALAASTPERQRPRSTEKARPQKMRHRRRSASSRPSIAAAPLSSRSKKSGASVTGRTCQAATIWQRLSVKPAMPVGRKRWWPPWWQTSIVFTRAASRGPRPMPSVMAKRKRDC
mmetsp:Transcript_59194/g.173139  ORF Transcript_59194/g.173139 Transcript_59194/m.173139 type:complete len:239 (+) Transcript_59194:225-941(+)